MMRRCFVEEAIRIEKDMYSRFTGRCRLPVCYMLMVYERFLSVLPCYELVACLGNETRRATSIPRSYYAAYGLKTVNLAMRFMQPRGQGINLEA